MGTGPAGPVAAGLNFGTPNLHINSKCGCGSTAAMHDLQRAGYSKLLLAIVCFCRKVELSEGLRLLQPRLIAGVSVAHVPSPATGKQTKKPINGFHRGRLAARRKS